MTLPCDWQNDRQAQGHSPPTVARTIFEFPPIGREIEKHGTAGRSSLVNMHRYIMAIDRTRTTVWRPLILRLSLYPFCHRSPQRHHRHDRPHCYVLVHFPSFNDVDVDGVDVDGDGYVAVIVVILSRYSRKMDIV